MLPSLLKAKKIDTSKSNIYDAASLDDAVAAMNERNTNSRFQSVEAKLDNLTTKVATIEGRLSAPESKTHPALIAFLSVCGAGLIAYLSWVGVKLVSLDETVSGLSTAFTSVTAPAALNAASSDPVKSENIELVKRVLVAARQQKAPIQPEVIAQVGSKFIEASKDNKPSWGAAIDLLNYRSTLNVPSIPPFPQGRCVIASPNAGITFTVEQVTLDGCTQELDHIAWKNVDFQDVTIIYHGGPTVLDNVRFINCHFAVDYTPQGQTLGESLFASSTVNINLLAR